MPRKARVVVPGMPHHIVQRGHNCRAVFVEEAEVSALNICMKAPVRHGSDSVTRAGCFTA